jgi:hypothetical protein
LAAALPRLQPAGQGQPQTEIGLDGKDPLLAGFFVEEGQRGCKMQAVMETCVNAFRHIPKIALTHA